MKYICLWVFIVSLLISTLALAAGKTVYVSVPSVNVRIGAGTQYKVVKSVPIGYPLRLLVEKDEWYQVELKDKTVGWVYKTMVTTDIPPVVKIEQLESMLRNQADEFERTRTKLQGQTDLNAKLEKKLEETQEELDKLARKNKELEKQDHIKLAGIGIGLLILGWIGGFFTGFFKRQAEDKRFVKMMIEANSLKKG
ncbi:MAG: SH3 domain-containing protein [bacterium]